MLPFWILTATMALWCIIFLSFGEKYSDEAPAFIQGVLSNDPFYPVWFNQCHSERKEDDIITEITNHPAQRLNCLDLECGIGSLVYKLSKLENTSITGLNNSTVFLEHCRRKIPLLAHLFITGQMLDYRRFDASDFSHIICPFLTIYKFDVGDKKRLLSNCYYWLKPGGTLVIYLFRDISAATSILSANSLHLRDGEESTVYSAALSPLDAKGDSGAVTFTQTFTNATTYARLHERILFIDSVAHILSIADSCGFHVENRRTSNTIFVLTKVS